MEVIEYQTSAERKPYVEWIRDLKDRQGVAVIRNRIKRLRMGQFGDHRSVGGGVWELRIFFLVRVIVFTTFWMVNAW